MRYYSQDEQHEMDLIGRSSHPSEWEYVPEKDMYRHKVHVLVTIRRGLNGDWFLHGSRGRSITKVSLYDDMYHIER